jgi:NADH-quinone oxidoreductase subunit D
MILDLLEWVSGARMLYNYIWIGGVARDLPEGWVEKARGFLDYFEDKVDDLNNLLSYNKIFSRTNSRGRCLTAENAIRVTGPNLRASGVRWDLRRNDPYPSMIASILTFLSAWRTTVRWDLAGTATWSGVWEIEQSVKILRKALRVASPVMSRRRSPSGTGAQGEVCADGDSRGEMGFYLISDGTDKPFRLKCRAPHFEHQCC